MPISTYDVYCLFLLCNSRYTVDTSSREIIEWNLLSYEGIAAAVIVYTDICDVPSRAMNRAIMHVLKSMLNVFDFSIWKKVDLQRKEVCFLLELNNVFSYRTNEHPLF